MEVIERNDNETNEKRNKEKKTRFSPAFVQKKTKQTTTTPKQEEKLIIEEDGGKTLVLFVILTRLKKGDKTPSFPFFSRVFLSPTLSLSLSLSLSLLSLYSAPSPSPPLPPSSSSSLNAIAATPESAVVLTAPFLPTAEIPFQRTEFFF